MNGWDTVSIPPVFSSVYHIGWWIQVDSLRFGINFEYLSPEVIT
jgi:hypothetical protein